MNLRKKLKSIIEQDNTKEGRIFNIFIQSLIIYSIITFTLESHKALALEYRDFFKFSEYLCITIFTIEYILRVYCADSKIKFIFSFYGLIDLFAILPFYIFRNIDLRSIRILRLFRLFLLFKFMRYSKVIKRYQEAFLKIKEELLLFMTGLFFLLYLSAVGIYYFESDVQPEKFGSIFDSLWWAIITMTTIGYGDVYPITIEGKIFASIIIIIGLFLIAVPTGLFASAITSTNLKYEKEDEEQNNK